MQTLDDSKATGLDRSPPKVLNFCANVLAYLVSNLVCPSFTKGIFSDCMRNTKVKPIYEVGLKRNLRFIDAYVCLLHRAKFLKGQC